jgi:hypothetical protein
MKEVAPLGKPYYRGAKGWPPGHGRWWGGQPMCPKFLHYAPNWWSIAKEDVSGEESGKRVSRWPAGHPFWPAGQALASTLPQLSPSTSSSSPCAQTTDQKHQKQVNFPSFFSKLPFIYYFFDFMTCNDGKQKHATEKE